jgi:hypothetical protein
VRIVDVAPAPKGHNAVKRPLFTIRRRLHHRRHRARAQKG